MKRLTTLSLMFAGMLAADPLRITVYNHARLREGVLESAFDQLQHIFRIGKIQVAVVQASSPDPTPDVAVQIISAPASFDRRVLGMALPDAGTGLRAVVFADHIQAMAVYRDLPYAAVLACAIAHEVGHLLLGTSAHVPYGVMAAVWNVHEYRFISRGVLFFTDDQYERMRSGLRSPSRPKDPLYRGGY